MAAQKIYDVVAKKREYTDRNGEKKAEWLTVGAILKWDDGGTALLLDRTFNPAGLPDPDGTGGAVRLSLFKPKGRDEQQQSRQAPRQQQPEPDFDQDIPF